MGSNKKHKKHKSERKSRYDGKLVKKLKNVLQHKINDDCGLIIFK